MPCRSEGRRQAHEDGNLKLPKVVQAALRRPLALKDQIQLIITYMIEPEYHSELYNDVKGAR